VASRSRTLAAYWIKNINASQRARVLCHHRDRFSSAKLLFVQGHAACAWQRERMRQLPGIPDTQTKIHYLTAARRKAPTPPPHPPRCIAGVTGGRSMPRANGVRVQFQQIQGHDTRRCYISVQHSANCIGCVCVCVCVCVCRTRSIPG